MLALVGVIVFGLWLRYPLVGGGMPYFYSEDEGHHFNRLVNMVKAGDLNPHYFNKPSLHFYLRMPAVAAAFLWSARADELQSIQDIDTENPFGLAGYAWGVSHPRIVMWVRSVSIILSLLIILVTFLLTAWLVRSPWIAVGAAWLVACSPALVTDSAKIGVDTLMTFMCLLTIYFAIRTVREPTLGLIVLTGLCAGLAISSKYNAAPIIVLPLAACVLSRQCTALGAAAALTTPVLGFFIGTPFAVIDIPQFLDGMAFEVRHYGVLGHGAATGEPGLPQARFYLGWMTNAAAGALPTALGILGTVAIVWRRGRTGGLFLLFPLLFGILMVNQKVNFTRNMLVMIPVVCVLALVTVEEMTRWLISRKWPPRVPSVALVPVLVLLVSLEPLARSIGEHRDRISLAPDNRVAVSSWLTATSQPYSDTAIAGELQFPRDVYDVRGVSIMPTDEMDPVALFLEGFDRLVVGPEYDAQAKTDLLVAESVFEGEQGTQRIRFNPEVTVYRLPDLLIESDAVRSRVEGRPRFALAPPTYVGDVPSSAGDGWACESVADELAEASRDHCWTHARLAHLLLDSHAVRAVVGTGRQVEITLDIMSPWPTQSCALELEDWASADLCAGLEPRQWEHRSATLPSVLLASAPPRTFVDRGARSRSQQPTYWRRPEEVGSRGQGRWVGRRVIARQVG